MEGHEACPEWACLECGHALLAGPFEPSEPGSRPADGRGLIGPDEHPRGPHATDLDLRFGYDPR
ncbi:hypothetical protein GCM10020219_074740 [Nonomuraea dietziae]